MTVLLLPGINSIINISMIKIDHYYYRLRVSGNPFKRKPVKCLVLLWIILLGFCFRSEAKNTLNWTGKISSDWNTPQNWTPQIVPGGVDDVQIGLTSFTNQLTVTAIVQCGTITMGTLQPIILTVNTGASIAVSGAITLVHSEDNLIPNTTVAGAGSITCGSLVVGNSDVSKIIIVKTTGLISTLANFNVTGNVFINSTTNYLLSGGLGHNNGLLSLQGGLLTVGGQIKLTNLFPFFLTGLLTVTPSSKFSIDINSGQNAQLRVLGSVGISINNSAWDPVDFYNILSGTGSSTVEYAGTNQTISTDATAGVNTVPKTYDNLIISGTGVKKTESNSGDSINVAGFLNVSSTIDLQVNHAYLSVDGNFYNTGTTKFGKALFLGPGFTNKGTLTTLTDSLEFLGGNQSLIDSTVSGTTLINTLMGPGTKTISTGNFIIASGGTWTVANDLGIVDISPGAQLTFHADNTGQSTMIFQSSGAPMNQTQSLQKLSVPSNVSAPRNLNHPMQLKKNTLKPIKKQKSNLKSHKKVSELKAFYHIHGIGNREAFVIPDSLKWYESNCFFYRTIHNFIS
jgi:trimeric autotransporter adhesin